MILNNNSDSNNNNNNNRVNTFAVGYKLRRTRSEGDIESKVAGYVRKNLSQPKFAQELKHKLDDAYKLTKSR